MIKFENVSKVYENGVKALDEVSFEVEKGEFVFLVGSSAAGKSTLIKLMLREVVASSGSIHINDIDVSKLKHRQIPYFRRNIGVVFQDFRLLPNKNVYKNVAYAMEIVGASNKKIKSTVPKVLSMVGLADKAKMYPAQLSGGEQQRVVLARAIVNRPAILIADEPTGNLDPETASEIMQIIENINLSGTTVIMATHAEKIVDSMKKRVIELEKGCISRDESKGGYTYANN
ncbi:MAG: cell division ATP-binding protein FtsE [Ruminococcaceae bacterium]|nr:cell division ATP-binding protein FtsE [Oscillospiraceae bacterium]